MNFENYKRVLILRHDEYIIHSKHYHYHLSEYDLVLRKLSNRADRMYVVLKDRYSYYTRNTIVKISQEDLFLLTL